MAGEMSWISLMFFFFKTHLFVEVNGAKFVPRARGLFDTEKFNNICGSLDWYAKALEINVKAQIDVQDCEYGGAAMLSQFFSFINAGK